MGKNSGIAVSWLEKAQSDFVYSRHSLEAGFLDWAQLAAQQSAEKALKAVCISRNLGLIRTHDLHMLARKLNAPKEIISQSSLLNSFYTISRYPDVAESMDKETSMQATKDAVKAAEEVIAWCKKQMQA